MNNDSSDDIIQRERLPAKEGSHVEYLGHLITEERRGQLKRKRKNIYEKERLVVGGGRVIKSHPPPTKN